MRDSRAGEALWREWSGNDYSLSASSAFTFFTIDHVDLDNELVRRALASSIQREGIAESLHEAFQLLSAATISHIYAGEIDGDREFTTCDINGETIHGDTVSEIFSITWVEFG